MGFLLTVLGILLLAVSLAGVTFGFFMATDPRTRDGGWLFAIWWVPAVAASSGVLMRDVVTFTVGILCFLVAGVVFVLRGEGSRRHTAGRKGGPTDDPGEPKYLDSERPTRENAARPSRRAVS